MSQLVFQSNLGGQITLVGTNTSSGYFLNVPAINGNLVTTGDTGTVTATMLSANIYNTPGAIGSTTPNSGAFTTLSASSTVSGTGFSNYLKTPPAIGSTTPNTGAFTTLTATTSVTAPNLQGPTFAAYQSTNQTLATSTDTKIQFQTKEWDTASCFDNTTNYRFTPNVAGYYQVNAALNAGAFVNFIGITIRKNGTAYKTGNNAQNSGLANVSSLVYLNGTTDYIEIWGNFSSGQVTGTGISQTYFNASLVRSA